MKEGQRDRETERQKDRNPKGQMKDGQRDRQTESQSDRQTERQRKRQTDKNGNVIGKITYYRKFLWILHFQSKQKITTKRKFFKFEKKLKMIWLRFG